MLGIESATGTFLYQADTSVTKNQAHYPLIPHHPPLRNEEINNSNKWLGISIKHEAIKTSGGGDLIP
jgi:hypothetical protein